MLRLLTPLRQQTPQPLPLPLVAAAAPTAHSPLTSPPPLPPPPLPAAAAPAPPPPLQLNRHVLLLLPPLGSAVAGLAAATPPGPPPPVHVRLVLVLVGRAAGEGRAPEAAAAVAGLPAMRTLASMPPPPAAPPPPPPSAALPSILPTAVAITLPVTTARRLDLGTLVEGRRSEAGDWGDVRAAVRVGDSPLPSPVGRIGAVPGRAADDGWR